MIERPFSDFFSLRLSFAEAAKADQCQRFIRLREIAGKMFDLVDEMEAVGFDDTEGLAEMVVEFFDEHPVASQITGQVTGARPEKGPAIPLHRTAFYRAFDKRMAKLRRAFDL